MPFTTNGKNAMLDALGVTQLSLHSGAPGTTGANELSGGSPAYARKSVTFAAASGGSKSSTGSVAFDVPAGATVAYVGLWASSTFVGYFDATDETYASQGVYTVTSTTIDLNAV